METRDWFGRWATYFPQKVAVKQAETGKIYTYSDLNRLGAMLASEWKNSGIKNGDRVAILAENTIEYIVLLSAAFKSGVILVPLNYRLAAAELAGIISDCSPALLYYESEFLQKSLEIRNKVSIPLFENLQSLSIKLEGSDDDDINFENFCGNSEDDPLFILYTSGTTGQPKGALYTYRMLFWNSINTGLRLDITSSDRSVSCMPLFHTGGWNVIPTPFFHRGAYVCFARRFDADSILQLLQSEECTMFVAVPTMLQLMAQSPLFSSSRLISMRYFIVGGEPLPLPLIKKWHGKGIPVRQGYGLTEAGPSVTSLHQDDALRKMGSIGTVNFYLDYMISDEDGNPVPRGESGEFLLKGPSVTPGYWQNRELTIEALRNGWFHTGDVVREDEDGFLFVVDRKKNMYITGGENVYPAEVEKFLLTIPEIGEVCVIGVPDAKWGETGVAYVVPSGTGIVTSSLVLGKCSGQLARYKIPSSVFVIENLPKNDTGKIDRKKLLHLYQQSQTNKGEQP